MNTRAVINPSIITANVSPSLKAEIVLGTLPRTPWGIAHRLKVLNVKGVRKDVRHCPIAVYLQRNEIIGARVCPLTISFRHDPTYIYNSRGLKWFIRMFDLGFFKSLRY